jgi:hypothetical protein
VGSDSGFDKGFGRGPGRDGSERREGDDRRGSDRHPGPTAQERRHRVSPPEGSRCGGGSSQTDLRDGEIVWKSADWLSSMDCCARLRLALLGSWAGLGWAGL